MKKLTTIMAVGLGVLAFTSAKAQVGLHVSLNLGGVAVHSAYQQPVPVNYSAYDDYDDYYYLPEVEAYYSVPQHCYYYNDGARWVSSAYLPGAYRNYDWRSMRRFEVRENRPFMHHDRYRNRFGGYQGGRAYAGNNFYNRGEYNTRPDMNNRSFDRPDMNRGGFGNGRGYNGERDRDYKGSYSNNDGRNSRGRINNGGYQYGNAGQYHGGVGNGQNPGAVERNMGGNQNNSDQRSGQWQGRGDGGSGNRGGQDQNRGAFGQRRGDNQPMQGNGNSQPPSPGRGFDRGGNANDHFAANRISEARPARF